MDKRSTDRISTDTFSFGHLSNDDLLREGLTRLCRDDADTNRVLAPRLDAVQTRLISYIAEIELFNPAYGLVKVKDRRELVIKHILDSLAPLGILIRLLEGRPAAGESDNAAPVSNSDTTDYGNSIAAPTAAPQRIADVGSGAGLPGIPLAIALPEHHFTLIERMGRRAGFLRNTQAVLTLSNIAVEESEMEKAEPARFDIVTFRAFRPLEPAILRGLFRLLGNGGRLAAYKGRRETAEAEIAAARAADPSITGRCVPCPVPFLDEERGIVVIDR
jgi:16S rRNA (guanine527-N7)-methyltransferase